MRSEGFDVIILDAGNLLFKKENLGPGTPKEMAYACLYLGSDEASYCNGVVLPVDGGTVARQ